MGCGHWMLAAGFKFVQVKNTRRSLRTCFADIALYRKNTADTDRQQTSGRIARTSHLKTPQQIAQTFVTNPL